MTATAATTRPPRVVSGMVRRRWAIAAELVVAVVICFAGYFLAATWFREHEAAEVVAVLHLLGVREVSGVFPGHILIFRGDGAVLDGVVTTSCSSLLTVTGLTALNVAVMRSRRGHALLGLIAALATVVAANGVRLVLSALAGLWWGGPAMTLFHDWIGTLWALATTLAGFLVMVAVTLPSPERAEQDLAGRHTARRPSSWARPGLGYRAMQPETVAGSAWSLAGFLHRRVLPRRVSRRMASKREAGRIDYRLGHLPPAERIAAVRRLAADGLGAHTATLIAVATYEEDAAVVDALADAVAARQWEPITNDRIAALRLWARGWLTARSRTELPPAPSIDTDDEPVLVIAGARPPVPAVRISRRTQPPTFARPVRDGDSLRTTEDMP